MTTPGFGQSLSELKEDKQPETEHEKEEEEVEDEEDVVDMDDFMDDVQKSQDQAEIEKAKQTALLYLSQNDNQEEE